MMTGTTLVALLADVRDHAEIAAAVGRHAEAAVADPATFGAVVADMVTLARAWKGLAESPAGRASLEDWRGELTHWPPLDALFTLWNCLDDIRLVPTLTDGQSSRMIASAAEEILAMWHAVHDWRPMTGTAPPVPASTSAHGRELEPVTMCAATVATVVTEVEHPTRTLSQIVGAILQVGSRRGGDETAAVAAVAQLDTLIDGLHDAGTSPRWLSKFAARNDAEPGISNGAGDTPLTVLLELRARLQQVIESRPAGDPIAAYLTAAARSPVVEVLAEPPRLLVKVAPRPGLHGRIVVTGRECGGTLEVPQGTAENLLIDLLTTGIAHRSCGLRLPRPQDVDDDFARIADAADIQAGSLFDELNAPAPHEDAAPMVRWARAHAARATVAEADDERGRFRASLEVPESAYNTEIHHRFEKNQLVQSKPQIKVNAATQLEALQLLQRRLLYALIAHEAQDAEMHPYVRSYPSLPDPLDAGSPAGVAGTLAARSAARRWVDDRLAHAVPPELATFDSTGSVARTPAVEPDLRGTAAIGDIGALVQPNLHRLLGSPIDQAAWERSLCNVPGLDGDVRNLAERMTLIGSGTIALYQESENTRNLALPDIYIDSDELRFAAFAWPLENSIVVAQWFLEWLGRLGTGEVTTLHAPRGETVHTGPLWQILTLVGVEKGSHVLAFRQQPRCDIATGDSRSWALTMHDAAPRELIGLHAQRRIAVAKGFDPTLIDNLDRRWYNGMREQHHAVSGTSRWPYQRSHYAPGTITTDRNGIPVIVGLVSTEFQRICASSSNPGDRLAVARYPELDPDLVSGLSRDDVATVRAAVANRRSLPHGRVGAVRSAFAQDPSPLVREANAPHAGPRQAELS